MGKHSTDGMVGVATPSVFIPPRRYIIVFGNI